MCHLMNGWGTIVFFGVYLHVITQAGELSQTNLVHRSAALLHKHLSYSDQARQQWRKLTDLSALATAI